MFNIPVKKLRGIEKGTYVVLTDFCKEHAKGQYSSQIKRSQKYANKFLEMGYIVDNDVLKDGNFCLVVPILFDKNDPWQRSSQRYITEKGKSFVYHKKSLVVVHSNPHEVYDKLMQESFNRYIAFPNTINRVNANYGSKMKNWSKIEI